MTARISWQQALAWRMERHLLDPVGKAPVEEVVRRLCGVQAQVASSAELAIRVRRAASRRGEVSGALSEGRLTKTWAMRGALHLLAPEEGGAFLSLMGADRLWESWRRYFGMTTNQMELLRRAIRTALEGAPVTRVELAEAVMAQRRVAQAGEALLGLGGAPEASRVAGRPVLRTEPGHTGDLHDSGGSKLSLGGRA